MTAASAKFETTVYDRAILYEAPRLFSMIDRSPSSPTAGSGDRTHWSWKFTDFAGTRFQESACVAAYLWATAIEASPYYKSAALLSWIELILLNWVGRQHADGSFDEAYPYERALAATAFTSFYVAEAVELLGPALSASCRSETERALVRAGEWLIANDETHGFLSNHLAAAAAALMNIALLTREERFRQRSQYFVEKIKKHQSPEGWYEEYGGADPGYQTHGLFYLARLQQKTRDSELLRSMQRACEFQRDFIHPDGSLGGEYTSRNTQTYYPAAFEMLAPSCGAASWISKTMREHVCSGRVADLRGVDSYNYLVFLNNFTFAARALRNPGTSTSLPDPPLPGLRHYPLAGLVRREGSGRIVWVGTRKGGVVKVFDQERKRLVYSDCGWIGDVKGRKKKCSTQSEGGSTLSLIDDDGLEIRGGVFAFSRPVMTPFKFALFRGFTLTVGRVPGLAYWLKSLLVKVLIYKKKDLGIDFVRKITWKDGDVVIEDRLKSRAASHEVAMLTFGQSFTTIHMGSSRYFVEHELLLDPARDLAEPPITPAELSVGVRRERRAPRGDA